MRNIIEEIRNRFSAFVIQSDNVALILEAQAEDSLPLLSTLESIEADLQSDFFWTFTDEFNDQVSYAEDVFQAFNAKHQAVAIAQKREKISPWPPIPEHVKTQSTPPHVRLRDLATFSRRLLPIEYGGATVWTYFPLKINDTKAYAKLVQKLIDHDFPFPWCHHLRFIFRDESTDKAVGGLLCNELRVEYFAPDLSREALNKSIDDEVADDSLPIEQRMSSLLMSAGNDLAFNRFPDALEKYGLLLQYHGSMNNYVMGALVMHGMGQVYERMEDESKAEQSYTAAAMLSSQGDHPSTQVQLNIVLSNARLRESQERWMEAEGYWDSAQQLATMSRDGPLRARALKHRGLCQQKQKKLNEAETSWLGSSVIAAQLEESIICKESLQYLLDLYVVTEETGKEQAMENYLAAFH